jgi:long-chain acyl-CoA synthetase
MSELLEQINFECLYFKDEKYDQHAIKEAIESLSKYLDKNICSQSPFILLSAYNHIKTVIAYYAILKVGKIAVIQDPLLKRIELIEMINDVSPAAVFNINDKTIAFNYNSEITFMPNKRNITVKSDLTDVCTISYTNAEDGFSKGAMLTQKNLIAEAKAIINTNYLNSGSVLCALLPFSHLYGFAHGILAPTLSGGKGFITEVNLLEMAKTVGQIKNHAVTHLHTVPSIYYILGKMPYPEISFQHIKEFYSGGIQLPEYIFNSFYQKTGKKIREGYGLTEGSPAVAGNYQEEDPVFGSFGKAFPGCEIKIMNGDNMECKPGEVGEICVRGEMVFKGYLNYPDTTNDVLKNQWLYTGDFGRKDSNGFIYFCGLKKNMINIAGNKLYPQKLVRYFKMNKNVVTAGITCENSILQGSTIKCNINLRDNSKKSQEEFKQWCFQNINSTFLPKTWIFE